MNSSELIKATARKSQVDLAVVQDVLATFLDLVALTLAVEEPVYLRQFGQLKPSARPTITIPNPQNGQPMVVPGRRTVSFKPSKNLKERLNAGPL